MTTQDQPAADRLTVKLPPVAKSPKLARNFISHHLTSLGFADLVDDGCLIASELVTNAIQAAPTSAAWLCLSPHGGEPLLEVWDASPKAPVLQVKDLYAESGRGLLLTGRLSKEWGYIPLNGGKIVWAVLARKFPDAQ